jgi:putative membrane protein
MDRILDSLDGMSGSLNAAANGLDQLNTARGQISAGKGEVYGKADLALEDLEDLAQALEPMNGHLDTASQAVDDLSASLGELCDEAVSLRSELRIPGASSMTCGMIWMRCRICWTTCPARERER